MSDLSLPITRMALQASMGLSRPLSPVPDLTPQPSWSTPSLPPSVRTVDSPLPLNLAFDAADGAYSLEDGGDLLRMRSYDDPSTGFRGALYQNQAGDSSRHIFSIAGTHVPSLDALVAGFEQARNQSAGSGNLLQRMWHGISGAWSTQEIQGFIKDNRTNIAEFAPDFCIPGCKAEIPPAYHEGLNIARRLQEEFGSDLVLVGHSQGGANVGVISAILGIPAIAINPPALSPSTRRFVESQKGDLRNAPVLNVIAEADGASRLTGLLGGEHPGRVEIFPHGDLPGLDLLTAHSMGTVRELHSDLYPER